MLSSSLPVAATHAPCPTGWQTVALCLANVAALDMNRDFPMIQTFIKCSVAKQPMYELHLNRWWWGCVSKAGQQLSMEMGNHCLMVILRKIPEAQRCVNLNVYIVF